MSDSFEWGSPRRGGSELTDLPGLSLARAASIINFRNRAVIAGRPQALKSSEEWWTHVNRNGASGKHKDPTSATVSGSGSRIRAKDHLPINSDQQRSINIEPQLAGTNLTRIWSLIRPSDDGLKVSGQT